MKALEEEIDHRTRKRISLGKAINFKTLESVENAFPDQVRDEYDQNLAAHFFAARVDYDQSIDERLASLEEKLELLIELRRPPSDEDRRVSLETNPSPELATVDR